MSGLIYFKLRSQLSFSTVTFDGHFVSVGEARRLIAAKMNLGTDAISELVLTDPRTGGCLFGVCGVCLCVLGDVFVVCIVCLWVCIGPLPYLHG